MGSRPDGTMVATGAFDAEVKLWDVRLGTGGEQ